MSERTDKTIILFFLFSSKHFSQWYPKTWCSFFIFFSLFLAPSNFFPISCLPFRKAMAIYLHLVSFLQCVCVHGRKVRCHSWAFTPAKANELSLTLILAGYLELHTKQISNVPKEYLGYYKKILTKNIIWLLYRYNLVYFCTIIWQCYICFAWESHKKFSKRKNRFFIDHWHVKVYFDH